MLAAILSVLGTAGFAALGWAMQRSVSIGNRVSIIETKQEDLPVLINMRFAEVSRRLDRIERAMNGHLRGVD